MDFKEGKVFEIMGKTLCVLDLFELDKKNYALFSVEGDSIEFKFYEIIDDNTDYILNEVENQDIYNRLMLLYEERNK